MSTIQEQKTAPEHQDFKNLSQSSKDVMDALKESALTTRSEAQIMNSSKTSPGQFFKETLTKTYTGVPISLEAEALQKAVMHSQEGLEIRKTNAE